MSKKERSVNLRQPNDDMQELAILRKDVPEVDRLLSIYPIDVIEKLMKDKEKLIQIAKTFNEDFLPTVSKGVMWMVCDTDTCPYKDVCILNKHELAPVGYQCPIERKISDELEMSLIDELDIDIQNATEMELLYDLIDVKLLDMRASKCLAENGLTQEIVINNGRTTTVTKDIAPEVKIKLDLKKLKFSIMDDFVATRKAKKRYGISGDTSSAERMIRDAMNIGKDNK